MTQPTTINPGRWHVTAGELADATARAELLGERIRFDSPQMYKASTMAHSGDPGFWLFVATTGNGFDRLRDDPADETYHALYLAREHAIELMVTLVKALAHVARQPPSQIVAALLEGALADESA